MGFVRCRFLRLAEFGIKRIRSCEDLAPSSRLSLLPVNEDSFTTREQW